MEVILLEKVANLGALGDRVTVKAGYGRNYLIPQAKAVAATADNIEAFESRRAELEKEAAQILSAAEARATAVAALELTISANAGEEGKLFGSVGARDIAQAAEDAGVELDRSEIRLPDGPVREVGEYAIEVGLHPEVETMVKVIVVSEEALES